MRDNQPKHRQTGRARIKLSRQKANRKGLPAILILCEGRQTEPNYINGLCESNRVNLANVRIYQGTSATDVTSLVKRAQSLFSRDRDFDSVFVVFDDDGQPLHRAYELAKKKLRTVSGEVIEVQLIVSRPCFEIWLLLHFEYTARPFASAAEVIAELRTHVPNYDKADPGIFGAVATGLDAASRHALRLKRELEVSGASSPNTDFHKLVEQLMQIKRDD